MEQLSKADPNDLIASMGWSAEKTEDIQKQAEACIPSFG
jgi:hypothetical protein